MTAAAAAQPGFLVESAKVVDLRRASTSDDHLVRRLQEHLRRGLAVEPDPRRPDFYEAVMDGTRCYFHVFRSGPGRVYLLACW